MIRGLWIQGWSSHKPVRDIIVRLTADGATVAMGFGQTHHPLLAGRMNPQGAATADACQQLLAAVVLPTATDEANSVRVVGFKRQHF